jgi:hypothetical protein
MTLLVSPFRTILAAALVAWAAWPSLATAHCDGLDGPVVKDARRALEKGDPALILPWVQQKDEAEIRGAFQRTLGVRKLGGEAQALADTWFFETLVRVHRAAEGEPYTGLKPAGRDLGPAIPAADTSLETGKLEPVANLLTEATHSGLHQRFERALAAKAAASKAGGVPARREFVARYVDYLHYVEGLHAAASRGATDHASHAAKAPAPPPAAQAEHARGHAH